MYYKKINKDTYLLCLYKGDYLNKSLEKLAKELDIKFAQISGIGALKNPTLGLVSSKEKKYFTKEFIGEFELTSLQGNISWKESTPFSHTHVTLADKNYNIFGGHLMDAKIAVVGEIFIKCFNSKKEYRKYNDNIGIDILGCTDL